jgi:glycosyltransferase involved in cell wall biosynthesis
MKICAMSSVYALSEEDRHAAFLVEGFRHLMARGHQVTVLAPSYRGLKSHTVNGVKVVRFRYFFGRWETLTHGQGAPSRVGNPLYFAMAGLYVLSGMIAAIALCRRERFDVLHVQWPFPHALWGIIAGRLFGIPMVYTFHGAEVLLGQRFGFVNAFLRWALKFAGAVTCNSSYTAAKVRQLGAAQVEVLPYGASVNTRSIVKVDRVHWMGRNVLFVGRLIPRKGLQYLIEALALIDRTLGCRLQIVGDGPEGESCRVLAERIGVLDRIDFLGFVPNEGLEALYAQADAFVLPSIVDKNGDTEGLGVVLIEAMSFGTPVIASAVGGIVDVVRHDQTGLLVAEKSPRELADAITRILNDQPFADRLAAAAHTHVAEYFNWDRITDRLEDVYGRARDLQMSGKTVAA